MSIKTVVLSIVSAGLLVSLAMAGEKIEIKDQKARDSYSLGYQFGRNVAAQEVEIDKEVLVAGVRDALDGKKPLLYEIDETVNALRNKIMLQKAQRMREQAAKNLEEAKAFLAANGKKEGIVTLPSGLQYKVIREG